MGNSKLLYTYNVCPIHFSCTVLMKKEGEPDMVNLCALKTRRLWARYWLQTALFYSIGFAPFILPLLFTIPAYILAVKVNIITLIASYKKYSLHTRL